MSFLLPIKWLDDMMREMEIAILGAKFGIKADIAIFWHRQMAMGGSNVA